MNKSAETKTHGQPAQRILPVHGSSRSSDDWVAQTQRISFVQQVLCA